MSTGDTDDEINLESYAISVGFPSFKEVCEKTKDMTLAKAKQWMKDRFALPDDMILQSADRGTSLVSNVKKHNYIFETKAGIQYNCGHKIEKLEEIIKEEGLTLKDVELCPEMREDTSCAIKIDVIVKEKVRSAS